MLFFNLFSKRFWPSNMISIVTLCIMNSLLINDCRSNHASRVLQEDLSGTLVHKRTCSVFLMTKREEYFNACC